MGGFLLELDLDWVEDGRSYGVAEVEVVECVVQVCFVLLNEKHIAEVKGKI